MAYYHARANVCRAGVTRAGLAHHPAVVTIGATDRTNNVLVDDFTITTALDGSPSSCQMTVQGFTPALGSPLTLALGGEVVWRGTILDAKATAQKFVSGAVFWHLQAVDTSWDMDRYGLVNFQAPAARGVNGLVGEILRSFTDPASGFGTGYIPMELGDVGPFVFHEERVSSVLRKIAQAAGASFRVTPRRTVDIFTSLPTSNALSISNSSEIRQVSYETSLSQARTRSFFAGGGAQTTAVVEAGATEVPVDECSWYTGTLVETPGDRWNYTGRSVESGPGSLTGCSGIAYELPQGTQVSVLGRVEDLAAEVALAALFGFGLDGRMLGWFSAGGASQEVATGLATDDVALYKSAIPALSYTTAARFHEPGKSVTVSTTDPLTISGTFKIQSVTMRPFGPIAGNTPRFEYQVQCRLVRRHDLFDVTGTN